MGEHGNPSARNGLGSGAESIIGDIRRREQDEAQKEDVAWVRGDPGCLGLLAFGMTTCMLMFIKTRWSEKTFLPTVFSYALFYGGLGQLVAGVLELIKGNTFGGTAFASYGSFWMGWFLMEYLAFSDPGAFRAARTGTGLWCGLWAVLTAGFFVVTLRKNGCLVTVFSTLVTTFALLAGGVWDERCEQAAGYVGLFCGASAIYGAFATLFQVELGFSLPGVRPVNWLPIPHGASVRPLTQPSPPQAEAAVEGKAKTPSGKLIVTVMVAPSKSGGSGLTSGSGSGSELTAGSDEVGPGQGSGSGAAAGWQSRPESGGGSVGLPLRAVSGGGSAGLSLRAVSGSPSTGQYGSRLASGMCSGQRSPASVRPNGGLESRTGSRVGVVPDVQVTEV